MGKKTPIKDKHEVVEGKETIRIRRLLVGEKIRIGDYCCNPDVAPVRTEYADRHSIISQTHHPFYRVISKKYKY